MRQKNNLNLTNRLHSKMTPFKEIVILPGTKEDSEVKLANRMSDEDNPKDAIKILKKVVKKFPGDRRVWLFLGRIYYDQLNNSKMGEIYFRKAIEIDPGYELASVGLFHCLNNQNKTDSAFGEMRRFLKSNPDSKMYAELIKEIEAGYGDWYEAEFRKNKVKKISSKTEKNYGVRHYTSLKRISKIEKLVYLKSSRNKS